MKHLLLFFVALIALEELDGNIIHHNGDRSEHTININLDVTDNRPAIHRNQIPPPQSYDYQNTNSEDHHGVRRTQHHRGRTPERSDNLEHNIYSNVDQGSSRINPPHRIHRPGTGKQVDSTNDNIYYNYTDDSSRINEPHYNHRPGTGHHVDNTKDMIYYNYTDGIKQPTTTSPGNVTVDDRFLTNPGDNCAEGEVRDLVTMQCRPEIKDD